MYFALAILLMKGCPYVMDVLSLSQTHLSVNNVVVLCLLNLD